MACCKKVRIDHAKAKAAGNKAKKVFHQNAKAAAIIKAKSDARAAQLNPKHTPPAPKVQPKPIKAKPCKHCGKQK